MRLLDRRGNAILFSLLIMSSAIVIVIGMATLVAAEIRNAGLTAPSERAYYKAESYVEQALWNKKLDATYAVDDWDVLKASTVHPELPCAPADACFGTTPGFELASNGTVSDDGLLKYFTASTSPLVNGSSVIVEQDGVKQFDVDTSNLSIVGPGTTGKVTVSNLSFVTAGSANRLEATIVAYPKNPAAPLTRQYSSSDNGTGNAQKTPVFIDKKLLSADGTFEIGTGVNPLGDPYPPLQGYVYRLRLKALGSQASFKLQAQTPDMLKGLPLLSADFTVQAVAQDADTRRGIKVVSPASSQAVNIFDYVVFAETDINKLKSKRPADGGVARQAIKAFVYTDNNRNCTYDGGDTPVGGNQVSVKTNGSDVGSPQATDGSGNATFSNLLTSTSYDVAMTQTVSGNPPNVATFCNPTQQTQNLQPGETRPLSFGIKPPSATTPLYRIYGYYDYRGNPYVATDHFYTTNPNEVFNPAFAYGYLYYFPGTTTVHEGNVVGYVYTSQAPGTVPLYRSYNGSLVDHFYSLSSTEGPNAGWAEAGVTGYVYPPNACPAGTSLFTRWWSPAVGNHIYTTGGENPNNSGPQDGGGTFSNEGNAFCLPNNP